MYAAHRLDLSPQDLAFALAACARASGHPSTEELALGWSPDGLACLSVRSAFDLLLAAERWPEGSEIVFSAINVPDMAKVARAHGVVAVPADLDPRTLAPRVEHVERAVGPRTRAILVAHLFGGKVDLAPYVAIAERRGLLLLEDCAQAFRGPAWTGHPGADVSLFSFGPIKTATALGGALARVRDPSRRARMKTLQDAWPAQQARDYLRRVLKFAGLVSVSGPSAYRLVVSACAAAGHDIDDVMRATLRGFGGAALLPQIRRRPSAPLLALLARRLRRFDAGTLARRADLGARIARAATTRGVSYAGGALVGHTHWVVPVRADDPAALCRRLRREGFHASRRGSNLEAVGAKTASGRADAEAILERIVFLPAYPGLPDAAAERLLDAVGAKGASV